MREANWKEINEVLEAVLAIEISDRQDYLKNAEIDKDVLAEVESLLAFEEAAESSMHLSAVEFSKDFLAGEKENSLIGQEIGEYRIEKELGYGGMGAVYLASRTDGKFEQRVALKLLKREMNTAALRRRFQTEREILASLEHPNIARLLNAGSTSDKIPYIAMEYVEGLPIDNYCNKYNLDLEDRLNLFRKVCSAVDFAHRNLIVHRDLKPSNILVTEDGTPKLLDFGISKILSTDLSKINTATVTNMGAMTPSYASPEQLKNVSVTTATDIYSLGVILFEILCGHRPFEEKEYDIKEIYSAVLESEPPLPSALVDTASRKFKEITEAKTEIERKEKNEPSDVTKGLDEKTEANKTRQTKPLKSNIKSNLLKGDLDNIILKALHKEPERRYSSAENFAEDIERHQLGNPVNARPDTFSYRAGKFIKRNIFAVSAGAFIVLVIFGGVIATLWQARQAQAEAAKAQKINEFLQNVLNFSNPHWLSSNPKRNKEAKIADALDEALKNVDKELAGEPEVQAEILFTLGKTFIWQGEFAKAEELLERAISLFDQTLGEENLKSMKAKVMLGDCQALQSKIDAAVENYEEAIKYLEPRQTDSEDNAKFLAVALTDAANVYMLRGDVEKGKEANLESLRIAQTLTGSNRFMIPIVQINLGDGEKLKGNYKEAVEIYKSALDESIASGNKESFETGTIHIVLGGGYTELGQFELAETHLLEGSEIIEKSLGERNFFATNAKFKLGELYFEQGNYDKSAETLIPAIKILNEIFPKGHFGLARSQVLLGRVYTKQGKLKEGEIEVNKALRYFLTIYKEPNPSISDAKKALGVNLATQKRIEEAREMLKSALDGFNQTKGENHPDTIETKQELEKLSDLNKKS